METYALSDGDWGSLYALGTTASGLTMIWAGGLADRFRARALITVLLIIMAVFCLAMAFNSSVWLLPAVIFGLRLSGQGMLNHVAMISMVRWYTAARGRAVAIANLGFSIGEAFLPMIVVAILVFIPWQTVWVAAATLSILFMLLLRFLLVKERTPQSIAETTQAVGIGGQHWTRAQAIKHPLFWLLIPVAITPSMFTTAVFFQQVHLAQVQGWQHVHLVAMFPAFTAMGVIAGLIFGGAIDKWGSIRILPFMLIPLAIGLLIFSSFTSLTAGLIALLAMAITQGGAGTVSVAFWSEIYGTKHVGAIKALAAAFMVFGSAIGPLMTGRLIDLGYSFPTQMPGYVIFIIGVCGLTYFATHRFLRK
ncbi:MAG: MFS transporter, partial [Proteobacteria bacterium]|nr:MFS transporter [Pseudomonadota bacterium]